MLDGRIPDDVEYLYWVGCAGALEDRAKKATKAIAELLHVAGREVRGARAGWRRAPATRPAAWATSSCSACSRSRTSRPSTRPGVAAGTGQEGHRVLPALLQHHQPRVPAARRELRGHPPHAAAGHAGRGRQADARSTRSRRRSPTTTRASWAGTTRSTPRPAASSTPCPAPRPRRCTGARATGFCCGAGGARMWLEERTGKRINDERIDEALALDPDTVTTACPYCMVMLGDAVNAKKAAGEAKPEPRGHRRRPAPGPVRQAPRANRQRPRPE